MSKSKQSKGSVDRRSFLKGVGVGTGALTAALLSPTEVIAEPPTGALAGPSAVPVALRINGTLHNLRMEPRVTLLDALRNHLDITGAKKVCDRATCGACTVLMDNRAVYSCTVLAIEAQNHAITTIEGLARDGELHPVMAAFVQHDAQQCGFCTPGFVVACKAFLDSHPNATAADIHTGLGGNLCRCGTYKGITEAVLALAHSGKGGQTGGGRM